MALVNACMPAVSSSAAQSQFPVYLLFCVIFVKPTCLLYTLHVKSVYMIDMRVLTSS